MRFDVLLGLPPYGPPAISFTERGPREHREGLVVRFYPTRSDAWVGNFVGGMTAFNRVLEHPNKSDMIVVAGGEACIVDPESRTVRARLAGDIANVFSVPALELILLQGFVSFHAVKADNTEWHSNRISWDGFRKIEISGDELLGEAFSPVSDTWAPFRLDLLTGHCANGIYEEEMSAAVRITPAQDAEAGTSIWRIPLPKRPST